jgi:hypothetical protein
MCQGYKGGRIVLTFPILYDHNGTSRGMDTVPQPEPVHTRDKGNYPLVFDNKRTQQMQRTFFAYAYGLADDVMRGPFDEKRDAVSWLKDTFRDGELSRCDAAIVIGPVPYEVVNLQSEEAGGYDHSPQGIAEEIVRRMKAREETKDLTQELEGLVSDEDATALILEALQA